MTDSSRGEVTARMSILHSLTKYAHATKIQVPRVQSRLVITPEKVLFSMANHSTSGKMSAQFLLNKMLSRTTYMQR